MPVRVYALARDQSISSKEVVDVCVQLGIEVKSHMSAISEEDAARVVQAMKNRAARPPAPSTPSGARPRTTPPPAAIRREDYVPASGITSKVPDLNKLVKSSGEAEKKKAASGPSASKPKARPLPKMHTTAPARRKAVPSSKPPAPAQKARRVQKPKMRLSPEALRGVLKDRPPAQRAPAAPGRPPPPIPRVLPEPEPKVLGRRKGKDKELAKVDEEERPTPAHRPGAVAGREERQKSRGRRALERRRARQETQLVDGDGEEEAQDVARRTRIRRGMQTAADTKGTVRPSQLVIESPITVRTLSQATGIRSNELLRKLLEMNLGVTINDTLEDDVAQMLAMEWGVQLELKKPPSPEERILSAREADRPEDMQPRPPVVAFLGHVDHGKTSLLDALRRTNVVATESGGITQHIGAYQVSYQDKKVTFLDTPGHQAFTAMRTRGAQVTDVVVLVVAADDGVMPQTEEAISHARAAEVPIVVAVNKVDLPSANVSRVLQQLSSQQLIPVQWGGDVEVVETSAVTGQGLDQLLETLSLEAELRELKANAHKAAEGTCLEASLHEGRGVLATLLVQAGTLRQGDLVLCGLAYGRVKAMVDYQDGPVSEAAPATPVTVAGLNDVPDAGERFLVMRDSDLDQVREIVDGRRQRLRTEQLAQRPHISLENLLERVTEAQVKDLRLIVRADVRGSLEAISKELGQLKHSEVAIRVLHSAVGAVSESDVLLADASDAIIVGFRVVSDERARTMAEEKGVQIRRYDIIYQLTADIRESLEGLLKPELHEIELGRAMVQQIFKLSRVGTVAGCRVVQGSVERPGLVRLIREGRVIYPEPGSGKKANIQSLKRVKDDVREVREGFECGIKVAGYDDIKVGDVIEVYKVEETQRTL